jgi:DNA-binding transcriptional MerR regulator
MNDDTIIQQRVSGRSARAIARAQGCTLAEVSKVLDRFTETTIDDKTRKHTLALELAQLDELQETFYARALEGDVACGALITKIIERRCTMLGLYTPQTATLQVIEAEAPRETSTERLRAAIDRIRGKTHQDDPPVTDQDDSPSTH